MKHIGIRVCGVPSNNEILYFDEIAIVGDQLTEEMGFEVSHEDRARVDFLAEKGVIVDAHNVIDTPKAMEVLMEQFQENIKRIHKASDILGATSVEGPFTASTPRQPFESAVSSIYSTDFFGPMCFDSDSAADAIKKHMLNVLRAELERLLVKPYRMAFEAHSKYQPSSLLNYSDFLSDSSTNTTVLDVLINRFPLPTPDIPIEAILDFRADNDAMRALRRIRTWAANCGKKLTSPKEIEAEIHDLLDKYTEYMNFHKLKYEHGCLRTFVTTASCVVEDLLRFRFKNLCDMIFEVKTNSLSLTEAELKAPGREVAYIYMSRDKLVKTKT